MPTNKQNAMDNELRLAWKYSCQRNSIDKVQELLETNDGIVLSRATVGRRIAAARDLFVVQGAEEDRKTAIGTVDAVEAVLAARVAEGDLKAIDALLRWEAHRAKLEGTEAARKSESVREVTTRVVPDIVADMQELERIANQGQS